jgi:hypothetical protein
MPPGIGDNVKAPPSEESDKYGKIVSDPNTHQSFSINGNYIGNQVKGDVGQGNYHEGGTKQEKPTT